jgi:hypothetical protein
MSVSGSQERIPVIHIGMPKTATKTLQWRLFACHSEIFYLGRFDGRVFEGKHRDFDACRDQSVQSIMKQIAYDDIYNPDFSQCKELLQDVLAPAIEQNLLPVWSWESYSTDILAKRRVRARNLKKLFGEAKIIMTLRNPVALLESAYFQQLKGDNVGAYANKGRSPYYLPIDEWLASEFNGEILPHLEYAETIQAYVDQFGLENVSVFLFEDLFTDKHAFFKSICDAMGVASEEGIRLMDEKTDNERWTVGQIESLANIKNSYLQSLKFKFSARDTRKQMLGLERSNISIMDGPKAKAPISTEWQNKIYEVTEKGNRWLEEVFNLPLKKHGYYGEQE